MAWTLEASGTQAATISTEHTLATLTTNKLFIFVVDANAMVGGTTPDSTELRIYYTVLSGGTEQVAYSRVLVGVQSEIIVFSPPIPSDISCRFTLKQVAGTGRSYPWKVLSQ